MNCKNPSTWSGGGEPLARRGALKAFTAGAVASVVMACSQQPPDRPPSPAASARPSPTDRSTPSATRDDGETRIESIRSRDEIVSNYQDAAPGEFGTEVDGTQLSLPDDCDAAALTLDACGGPNGSAVDQDLLLTLRDLELPATLFINQRWAQANPRTMEEIVSEPLFEIQNHGTKHLPLSVSGQSAYGIKGTTSVAEVYDEIMINQRFLQSEYGLKCRYFRSGTAHLDEVSAQICKDLGLTPVNFTVNLDDGATLAAEAVASRAAGLSRTDIALGHFNLPTSGTGAGLAQALPRLLAQELRFTTLEESR